MNIDQIDLVARREIEARIAGPLLTAFMNEFDKRKTLEAARIVVSNLAREHGIKLASEFGGNSLADFALIISLWSKNGALRFDILEKSETRLSMNVTRCRYAEMYDSLGIRELGIVMSCSRDFALAGGFNPKIKLVRTRTIMESADYCDFRFTYPKTEK